MRQNDLDLQEEFLWTNFIIFVFWYQENVENNVQTLFCQLGSPFRPSSIILRVTLLFSGVYNFLINKVLIMFDAVFYNLFQLLD